MSFLDQYKQRLDAKMAPQEPEEPAPEPIQTNVMHSALVHVVAERARMQEELQELIIELFGWDAASTPGECTDLWEEAPTPAEVDAEVAAQPGPNKKAPIQNPSVDEMVVMQGGMGKIVAIDRANGACTVRNQQSQEKVFQRDQLEGPKTINNKRSWALKTAMPRG